ncbi:MAG: hypothetical protein PUB99_09665 [Oscillospiraceae bacterium]|nr:hypothetical protein [Oscillospiraceae bacterium]
MTLHEAMFEFMRQYPNVGDLFSFDFMEAEKHASSFCVVENDDVKRDIFGNRTGRYKFAIAEYKPISTDPFAKENRQNVEAVDAFIAWVRQQDRQMNYPNLGDNRQVQMMSAKRLGDGIDYIDKQKRVARYTFIVTVEYEERED